MASTINLTTLQQTLRLDTSQFDSAMAKASTDSDKLKSKLSGVGSFLANGFVTAVTAACTAIIGLGTYSVKVGSDFESSMSQVAATMGMTAEEINNGSKAYEMLSDAAKEAGATTKYSASDAASALNYLALAGYDAEKACDVLPSVLSLAQAGALDLADASDMVTDAMSALNIEANKTNVTHFGDELAKTASKSNTSVAQLGEAILTVGGTANYLAGGTVELNTALGILANNGIKGAEGGTHLRNVILSLSAPTDTAKAALEGLGLSVRDLQDADGNLLPLNEAMQKLNSSMEGLSQTEKAQVLSNLFNKTDLTAVNALLKDSGDSWEALYENITNADGACADMAETMNNNLQGQLLSLQSACEAFGLAIYDKLQVPLTNLAKVGVDSVRQLTQAFNEGGVSGLIDAAGNMLSGFISAGVSYAPKIVNMAVSFVQSFIEGLNKAMPDIANGAVQIGTILLDGFLGLIPSIISMGATLIINLAQGLASAAPHILESLQTCLVGIGSAIMEYAPQILDAGASLIAALAQGIVSIAPDLAMSAMELVTQFAVYIINNLPAIVESGVQLVISLVQGIASSLPSLAEKAIECGKAIWDALKNVDWLQLGIDLLTAIGSGILSVLSALGEIAITVGSEVWNTIRETDWLQLGIDILTFIGEGILSVLGSLLDIALDVGSQALDTIQNIDWAGLGSNLISFITSGITGTVNTLVQGAQSVATSAYNTINSIDWLGLGKTVLNTVTSGITGTVNTLVQGAQSVANSALDTIRNSSWYQAGSSALSTVRDGIEGTVSNLISGAQSVANSAINTIQNSSWYQAGSSALSSIANGLSNAVGSLTSAASSVARSALNAFQNTSFYSVGSNIVSGIVNGVWSGAQSLYNTLTSLASSALQRAKNFLGIRSPSRVFRDEVGKMMAQGIDVGFTDEMENVNKDIVDSINTDFDINPKLTTRIADRNALSGTNKGSIVFNSTIHVDGNADEITLAKIKDIAIEQVNRFDDALSDILYGANNRVPA